MLCKLTYLSSPTHNGRWFLHLWFSCFKYILQFFDSTEACNLYSFSVLTSHCGDANERDLILFASKETTHTGSLLSWFELAFVPTVWRKAVDSVHVCTRPFTLLRIWRSELNWKRVELFSQSLKFHLSAVFLKLKLSWVKIHAFCPRNELRKVL